MLFECWVFVMKYNSIFIYLYLFILQHDCTIYTEQTLFTLREKLDNRMVVSIPVDSVTYTIHNDNQFTTCF